MLSAIAVHGDQTRVSGSAIGRELDAAHHWFSVYSELYGSALAVRAGLSEIGACRRSQQRLERMVQQLSGRLQFWRERLHVFEGS